MTQKDISYTEIATASGIAIIGVTTGAQTWTVSQVATECDGALLGAISRLRKNGAIISKMIPGGDSASGDPPVVLLPQDRMTVSWAGLSPGAVCKATVIFDNGL